MAAAKSAVASRLQSLESELQAALSAGADLRAQLDARDALVRRLHEQLRDSSSPGAGAGTGAAEGRSLPSFQDFMRPHQGGGGRSQAAAGAASLPVVAPSGNLSPERFRSHLSSSNISPSRGAAPPLAGVASLLMMQPPVAAVSSGPVARTPPPSAGGPEASLYSPLSPLMETQSPAAAASASSGLLMRKSLQGLLARVHDVTNFVTEAAAVAPLSAGSLQQYQQQPMATVQDEGVGTSQGAGEQRQQSFGSSISRDDQQVAAVAAGGFPQQQASLAVVPDDSAAADLADRLAGLSQALAAFASVEAS